MQQAADDAAWLRRLLETQRWVQDNGPEDVKDLELITMDELQEVRRIWVIDKHEIEDLLPDIYKEAMGRPYPAARIDDHTVFDHDALSILREVCDQNDLQYELVRNLLDTERRFRTMVNRRGLFKEIEKEIRRCYYEGEEDALAWARERYEANESTFVTEDGHDVYADGLLEESPSEDAEPAKQTQPYLYGVTLNET
jgi:DNA sulfur modification protein DndC